MPVTAPVRFSLVLFLVLIPIALYAIGALTLRHRSFWLGFHLNFGVALSIKVVALLRHGVTLY